MYFVVVTVWEGKKTKNEKKRGGKRKIGLVVDVATLWW